MSRLIHSYLHGKYNIKQSDNLTPQVDKRYFKLPYIGKYSSVTKTKLQCLLIKFCKDIDISIAFTSCKIQDYFSAKDRVPNHLKSRIVYKFICASCDACYVGETTRHLSSRIKEHLNTDKASQLFQQLQESFECKSVVDHNCFSIIDHADTKWKLKLKEGLHISWLKPSLNKQVKHCVINLSV